ncbi:MAG: hypothetical protein FWD01_04755 [Defluviitaleaceae bacterium]|nr:hypothetical protein [Defluviitaleaceae bacterium]
MSTKHYDLKIRIAGNTEIPCYSAIKAKGYAVTVYGYEDDEFWTWNAEKDNRLFSATNPIELPGLISMWEVRGDNWRPKDRNDPTDDCDNDEYNKLLDNAQEYPKEE